MYGFKECSSCGALYNREQCCSNVSSVDNFVRDPNPSSYDETPDSSQQPPRNFSKCGGPFGGLYCRQCTCERCRRNYTDEVCALCCYEVEKSFVDGSNPNSFIDSPNIFNPPPQLQTYSYELCGNDAHYGYDCPPRVPFVYNQDPCSNQNFDNNFQQTSPSFPQQYLCCENCGGPHATFQCQPMNQYLYDSNSSGFDQFQPPQYYVMHQPPEKSVNDFEKQLKTVVISALEGVIQPPQETSVEILQARENLMKSIQTFLKQEYLEKSSNAIAPVLPIEEPEDSLIMRDDHLSTIPEKESDEFIKSSVKDLVPIPRESNDLTDYKSESDMPVCDDSSSKNEGLDDIVSIPPGKEIDHLDAIPDSIRSLLNQDIRLIEKLLNDDSPLYSPEELNYEIPNAIIESFSPSPIPIEDSDSLMEDIDLFLASGDSIPPGIENDDYDSEGDILFEELLHEDSLSHPKYETFHLIVVDDTSDNSTRELYVHVLNVLKSKKNDWKKILYDDPIDDLIVDPGGDIDETDAFLIDILTNIKDDFYDSEGDVLYLESLLSDDTTPNSPL
ncbi:hypothetical protein Tco_1246621 [Tanacetum coccineum]